MPGSEKLRAKWRLLLDLVTFTTLQSIVKILRKKSQPSECALKSHNCVHRTNNQRNILLFNYKNLCIE